MDSYWSGPHERASGHLRGPKKVAGVFPRPAPEGNVRGNMSGVTSYTPIEISSRRTSTVPRGTARTISFSTRICDRVRERGMPRKSHHAAASTRS
jgi:hypothetical protein